MFGIGSPVWSWPLGVLAQMPAPVLQSLGESGPAVAPNLDSTPITRIALVCVGLAVGIGVWALGKLVTLWMERWRARFIEQTEVELDEMLLQLPAARIINYSLVAAGGGGLIAFFVFGGAGSGWNWKIGLLFALLVAAAVLIGARVILRVLRTRRRERFNDQLEEALMGMSNSLKAGFSITQAIEMVVKQNHHPISIEFKLMLQQTHLGMSFEEALHNMARRVQSEDFFLVASAISTARQTGGDLTGVFDRLSVMIRERLRIQRRVRTLTAQGRLQGIVLGSLPMLLLLVLYMLDADMVKDFFARPLGLVLFLVVVALEAAGFLVIRKIVNIDI